MQGFAAIMQAQTGMAWLQFSKEAFAEVRKRQHDLLDPIIKRASDAQLTAQENANKWSVEDRDRYRSVFQPLQDKFIRQAENWDSPERQAKVAAEAKADVMTNAEAQRGALDRRLSALGTNPASGRFAGIERAAGQETGLAAAGAENVARNQARREGIALRGDAINIGAGLPSQSIGALGAGVGAGASAVSGNVAGQEMFQSATGIMDRGFGGAMQGWKGTADSLNDMWRNRIDIWKQENSGMGDLFGGLGQLAGMFMRSSKKIKECKEPVRGVLAALEKMPVEKWRYKAGEGDGGGADHVGAYAEDFKRETGLGDGKSISVVDAIGVTMAAVKELSGEVKHLRSVLPAASRGKGKASRSVMKRAA